jgi:2-dehydro-3-deoxygluconokinase
MGIYFLEMGAAQRPSKVIYDRAASSFAEIEPGMIDWEVVLADSDWLHWTGIVPAVSESASAACMEGLKVARKLGLTISCDISHRKLLWKWGKSPAEVMPEMLSYCDVAFGLGAAEAEMLFGIKPHPCTDKLESYEILCREVHEKSPSIKTMAATFRDSRSASSNGLVGVMWKDESVHSSKSFDISAIVDRIGGGDAFTAGIIYGLRTFGDDAQKIVDFATAASVLKHSIPGDFNLATLEEVEKLMDGDSSGGVAR